MKYLTILLLLLSSCVSVEKQPVTPNIELVAVAIHPWEKTHYAWIVVDAQGNEHFIPLEAQSGDILSQALGPLGDLAKYVVFPITAAP